ncbi:MAG: hypothetical protein ACOYM3_22355 [Terrimicrobiaceae bacterium]
MNTTHPTYSLKSNEADARRHLEAFWSGKSLGRPALAITARNPGHVVRPFPGDDKLTGHEKELLPEWHAHNAENALNSVLWLGESLPKVAVSGGITFFNELLGGTYTLNGGTAWVDERTDILEQPLPRFDPSHPLIVRLDERIRAMAEVVGRRGYVNSPVLGVDPLTALSLFRGGENLCFDLVESAGGPCAPNPPHCSPQGRSGGGLRLISLRFARLYTRAPRGARVRTRGCSRSVGF